VLSRRQMVRRLRFGHRHRRAVGYFHRGPDRRASFHLHSERPTL
jgi:hypothetical protein